MMRIIVVDDHPMVRNGLCQLLAQQHDMKLVAAAADGQEALGLLKDGLQADIVLTDLNMPVMDGLELTRQIVALKQGLRVLVLTLHPQGTVRQQALTAGAVECLSKDDDIDHLLAAIRAVHAA